MFETLIMILLGIIIILLLWANNSNQGEIHNKLGQLCEVTNRIHSLLRDKSK